MKRLLTVLAILVLGTCGAWASGIGVLSEYWSTADADNGFGWGGKINLDVNKYVALEIRGSYFPDLSKEDAGENFDLSVIRNEADVIGKIPISHMAHAYGGGGGGYYILDGEFDNGDSLDLKDEFGFFLLAGCEFSPVKNLGLFAEFKYTFLDSSIDEDMLIGDSDFSLNGPGGTVGAMWTW
jgi:hypothetical protein